MNLVEAATNHIDRKIAGTLMLLQNFGGQLEGQARENAPWTDRTGNARTGLRGGAEVKAAAKFALFLEHSIDYGVWLEKAKAGRYAIIGPTLDANFRGIVDALKNFWED